MADLDQDNKLLEDQEEEGSPCMLQEKQRRCKGNKKACAGCGWNPEEHERRKRLPLTENDKGLLRMCVEKPRTIQEG